jgi:hypothetical protein
VYRPKHDANVGSLWRTADSYGAAFLATVGRRYTHQASDTTKSSKHVPLHHYHREDDAARHAITVARWHPGQRFTVYQCTTCPPPPVLGGQYWHVGHALIPERSYYVESDVVHYPCGCKYGVRTDDYVWACSTHQTS